jgi:3-oxoacyl-[acyl-carrier protein] reductase
VSTFVGDFGRIDILVNCAGVYFPTVLGETSEAAFDLMVSSHLKSIFIMIHRVAPLMKRAKAGKVINIGSAVAFKTCRSTALYGAVKAAIVMLTKAKTIC